MIRVQSVYFNTILLRGSLLTFDGKQCVIFYVKIKSFEINRFIE